MRKLVAFLLAGAMMFSLAGCGGEMEEMETLSEETVQESVQKEDTLPVRDKAGERLSQIQESGVLLIGISPDYAPFAFIREENGEKTCAGSDVELGNYIAEKLGVEVQYVEMEFEDCLDAVKEGLVDMVLLGMLKKPERQSYMDFTDVYYQPGRQVLLVDQTEEKAFPVLEKLSGKTVVAQYGTLQAQLVIEQLPETYMEVTDSVTESVAMLRAGQADAVALDEAVAEDILEEYDDLVLAEAELAYDSEAVVGGVVKGEKEFLDAVNEILKEAAKQKLYLNWLDAAISQAAPEHTLIPAASPQEYYSASPAADSEQ